jgi:ATP-dependent protease ClpP protease subunit
MYCHFLVKFLANITINFTTMIGHVYINGQIGNTYDDNGNVTAKGVELIDVVAQIQDLNEVEAIHVHINSEGGYVSIGRSIAEFLKSVPNCFTIAETLCASIATEIHLAVPLQNRMIVEGTTYLIHNPWLQSVSGDASQLEEYAKGIKETESEMISMYAKATGISKEALSGLMKIETSLTSEQCLKLGFASAVLPKMEKRAVALLYNQKQINMKKPLMDRLALAMSAFTEALKTNEREAVAMVVVTDKGTLMTAFEDLVVGDAITLEDGTKPENGEYVTEDGVKIVVTEGVITELVEAEVEDELAPEMDALKAELSELKAKFEEQTTELAKAQEVAETVVAKMEELAKLGSNFTPPVAKAQFRTIQDPAKPKTMAERKAELTNLKK